MSLLLLLMEAAACSGPAAAERIAFAEQVGLGMFASAAVMGLIGGFHVWRRKTSPKVLAPLVIVVIAHPGFWMSANMGDCGRTLKVASIVFTIQALALLAWAIARPKMLSRD
ncbi:MAG: hypothetical protein ACI8RZ_007595 [Myxococcota bacterium]